MISVTQTRKQRAAKLADSTRVDSKPLVASRAACSALAKLKPEEHRTAEQAYKQANRRAN